MAAWRPDDKHEDRVLRVLDEIRDERPHDDERPTGSLRAIMARCQATQARVRGYRDAETRYDGKGIHDA